MLLAACRKMMSVLVEGQGQRLLLTKGAPESVLGRCSHALANADGGAAPGSSSSAAGGGEVVAMTEGMRRSLLERMAQYGGVSFRVAFVFILQLL
jgi:magnesium-transporting ATPase (P-type)